jgi:hypothetical protein
MGFALTLGFEHPGDLSGARLERREGTLQLESPRDCPVPCRRWFLRLLALPTPRFY